MTEHDDLPATGEPPGETSRAAADAIPAEIDDTGSARELEALRAELAERDSVIAAQRAAERELVGRVRQALLASDGDIDPELVTGETLEEVEASFEQARVLVDRVRERVAREDPLVVPAGAPGRAVNVPSTAIEKIRAGLAAR
jgi:hypothetical protein